MEFSRQEYWSRYSSTCPGDLPYPGIEPTSPAWQENPLIRETQIKTQGGILSYQQECQSSKRLLIINDREGVDKSESSIILVDM